MARTKFDPQVAKTPTDKYLAEAMLLWSKDLTYDNAHLKKKAHLQTLRVLRYFARYYLGLNDNQFKVYSNKAGIAVSGEVSLHTDPLPGCQFGIDIQVSSGFDVRDKYQVRYRTCKGITDYQGGNNNYNSAYRLFGCNGHMIDTREVVFKLCGQVKEV